MRAPNIIIIGRSAEKFRGRLTSASSGGYHAPLIATLYRLWEFVELKHFEQLNDAAKSLSTGLTVPQKTGHF
jgi:hypothetical protein